MNITIVCEHGSWMQSWIPPLARTLGDRGHAVTLLEDVSQIGPSDVTFLLSVEQIVKKAILARSGNNIVVHASALPKGRGWSPLTWQIVEGKNVIPLSLFEAEAKVDSGKIYLRGEIRFDGSELLDELRDRMGAEIVRMCVQFIDAYPAILESGIEQSGEPSYYPRRTAKDSVVDPQKSIIEQFDTFRVVDNERYPAYFDFRGHRYILRIYKISHTDQQGSS